VLLLRGAPDKRIWANLYNGVGGHVESGEDFASAARREILEETGLTVDALELRGVVNIQPARGETGIVLLVFRAAATTRETVASDEGTLEWVPVAEVDGLPVVEDVPLLISRALGQHCGSAPFFASYTYDETGCLHVSFAE
jgi:8-oxo-dGTP diphosphatase